MGDIKLTLIVKQLQCLQKIMQCIIGCWLEVEFYWWNIESLVQYLKEG